MIDEAKQNGKRSPNLTDSCNACLPAYTEVVRMGANSNYGKAANEFINECKSNERFENGRLEFERQALELANYEYVKEMKQREAQSKQRESENRLNRIEANQKETLQKLEDVERKVEHKQRMDDWNNAELQKTEKSFTQSN